MPIPTFQGEVIDGKLKIKNINAFNLYIGSLKGKVILTIKKHRKVRSTGKPGEKNINGYYWLYLTVISEETGDDQNSLHEYFKRKFLPPRFKKAFGKEFKIPATTTELTGYEMWNYMLEIENLTGIPIPPHPDDETNY